MRGLPPTLKGRPRINAGASDSGAKPSLKGGVSFRCPKGQLPPHKCGGFLNAVASDSGAKAPLILQLCCRPKGLLHPRKPFEITKGVNAGACVAGLKACSTQENHLRLQKALLLRG